MHPDKSGWRDERTSGKENVFARGSSKRLFSILLIAAAGALAAPVQAACFTEAGAEYGIDPLLLRAIAQVESSMNARAVNKNTNGTIDVGIMQINSIHFPRLAQQGITKERLLSEPCAAVMVGAEILSGFVLEHGYTWRAVGAYNAGSAKTREDARRRYVEKVSNVYRKLSVAVDPAAEPSKYPGGSSAKSTLHMLLNRQPDRGVGQDLNGDL